jgi:hypothetical protein
MERDVEGEIKYRERKRDLGGVCANSGGHIVPYFRTYTYIYIL